MATQRTQARSRRSLPVVREFFLVPPHRVQNAPLRRPSGILAPSRQPDLFPDHLVAKSPTAGRATKCGCYVTPTLSPIHGTFPC